MASNDPSPEDSHEAKSLLGPQKQEESHISMTTESPKRESREIVTMTSTDPVIDNEVDRLDDLTRRFLLLLYPYVGHLKPLIFHLPQMEKN